VFTTKLTRKVQSFLRNRSSNGAILAILLDDQAPKWI
jgi:hypothetical protein